MPGSAPRKLAFLFIGGPHQVFHLAPVAAALARERPSWRITCYVPDRATAAALHRVDTGLDVVRVEIPRWADWIARRARRHAFIKIPWLARIAPLVRDAAAIVTPERTSAFLRHLGVSKPMFIHFRHGAGDRAPRSEKRLRAFDLVVVPGEKDLQRALAARYLPPDRLAVGGYVKLDYLANAAPSPRPFDGDRETVIYNPHFDAGQSSWPVAREVIAAFAAHHRYNLIVAPHLRLGRDMGVAEREDWQALAVPGRIVVDLDSPRLIDMSYIRAADSYLGDMSSQLYEFLSQPRPVAFLNAHRVRWQDDPRYAGWRLGEVADDPAGVIAAIDRAVAGHGGRIDAQRKAVATAFGPYQGSSARGAAIVAEAVERRTGLAPV